MRSVIGWQQHSCEDVEVMFKKKISTEQTEKELKVTLGDIT